MLNEILHFFTGYGTLEFDKTGKPSEAGIKIATAAILWETCLADNELDELEVATLTDIMRSAFHISEKEVEVISAICKTGSSREKLDEFVRVINENFDQDQREQIVKYASQIAQSSHGVDLAEGVVCDVMRNRLNLS